MGSRPRSPWPLPELGAVCFRSSQGNIRVFCRVRPLLGEELAGVPGDDPFPQHIGFSPDGKSLELEKLADVGMNEVRYKINAWLQVQKRGLMYQI